MPETPRSDIFHELLLKAALTIAVVGAVSLASIAEADTCKLTELASLPIKVDSAGGLTVPASIEAHEKYLLVDTAGIYNLITHSAVEELGLSRVALNPDLHLYLGASGKSLNRVAVAHSFKLGNLVADKVPFIEMPDTAMPAENAGTLGPVVLANYDLEIDPVGGKLNLFSQQHCRGQVVYWTHSAYSAVPFRLDSLKHIIAAVVLDGRPLNATLDTGSSRSWAEGSSLNGVLGLGGVSPHTQKGDEVQFDKLTLEGISIVHPRFLINENGKRDLDSPPLVIGMNVLSKLHIFLSYRENMLYVTSADAH